MFKIPLTKKKKTVIFTLKQFSLKKWLDNLKNNYKEMTSKMLNYTLHFKEEKLNCIFL